VETELVISGAGFPPLSARGCVQELIPVSLGHFKRTVNGDLVLLGSPEKKYKSTISCDDKTVIATDKLAIGDSVEVSCIQRLWQKCPGAQGDPERVVTLDRLPVDGSIYALDEKHRPVPMTPLDGKTVRVDPMDNTQSCFVSYRPRLTMRLTRYRLKTDEWGVKTGWEMELEEA
jgi:hypothetical protein